MDTTLLGKIIEATAGSITSVILVILLRTEIRSLLPLIKKVKAGPLEAEFEREISKLRSNIDTSPALRIQ